MKYIDIHAHLNFDKYDEDRADVIARTKETDTTVINVGTDKKTSKEVVDLAKENDNMFAVIGLHPTYEEEFDT
ncbi:MAG: TatD DNase family protein, partial [Candidatus Paceibacteria bacterium]